jgi:hypothetical protein
VNGRQTLLAVDSLVLRIARRAVASQLPAVLETLDRLVLPADCALPLHFLLEADLTTVDVRRD